MLATDWASLRAQVLRWQGNTGLAWSDDDVLAVTRYLNDLYYRFPAPGKPVALRASLRTSIGWPIAPMDCHDGFMPITEFCLPDVVDVTRP